MSTAPTSRGSLGNLPAEVTSFVGRRQEVTTVRRMLSGSRLTSRAQVAGWLATQNNS